VSEIDDGGLAFPSEYYAEQGMTLRDYFAAAASEGDIANMREAYKQAVPNTDEGDGYGPDYKYPSRTKCRYLHAHEMLAARKEVTK
jgi:hypothetical protein